MLIQEVRGLVSQFESNRKEIALLQTKLDTLQRNYRNSWYKLRTECEKSGHNQDEVKNKGLGKRECPYCRKQLFPVRFYSDSWTPYGIFSEEYCYYWLDIHEKDWPAGKRKMLHKIKEIITDYFKEAELLVASLEELRNNQKKIKKELNDVFKLCDSVLKITDGYEAQLRACKRQNKPAPPFNDPDAFWD